MIPGGFMEASLRSPQGIPKDSLRNPEGILKDSLRPRVLTHSSRVPSGLFEEAWGIGGRGGGGENPGPRHIYGHDLVITLP